MADRPHVGVLVPSMFIGIAVETAIREVGAQPRALVHAEDAAPTKCRALVADLDAFGPNAATVIRTLASAGMVVLVFAASGEDARLRAARAAGAVAMSRASLLARLPELLTLALGSTGKANR